jgi:hypothetical protein
MSQPNKHSMSSAAVLLGGKRGVLVQTPRLGRAFPSKFVHAGEGTDLAFSLEGAPELQALLGRVEGEVQRLLPAAAAPHTNSRRFVSKVASAMQPDRAGLLRVTVPSTATCRVYDDKRQSKSFEWLLEQIQGYVELTALLELHHAWCKGAQCGLTVYLRAVQVFPKPPPGSGEGLGEGYPFLEDEEHEDV